MSRFSVRLLTVAGAAAALLGLTAVPALAHVTVNAPGATQGGFTVLTFRVPTESDTASTTGIKVQFPAEAPLAFVSIKPKAGWSYTVTRAKLATPVKTGDGEVTDYTATIDWKAAPGAGIKPGEFEEFQVSAGPLPKAASMTFKAIQTYSDGKTVSWIEVPPAGSTKEPDLPAPTLKLAAATTDTATGTTTGTAAAAQTGAAAPAAAASDSDAASKGSVTGAYVLGGLGLLAGLGGLASGVTRRRRPAATSIGSDREPAGTRAD